MNRTRGEIGTILSIVSLVVIAGGVAMGNFISSRLSSRITTTSNAQTPAECRFRTDIRVYKEDRSSDANLMTTADFPKPLSAQTNRNTYLDLLTGDKLRYDLLIPNLILDSGQPGTFRKDEEAWVELEGKPDAQGKTSGLNDTGWYVKEEFCFNNTRSDGSLPVQGCPSARSLVFYNRQPDRKIEGFRINCGVDITYGWVLTRTKPGSGTTTPAVTSDPNKPTGATNPTSIAPTTSPSTIQSPIPSTSTAPTKSIGACTCDEPIKPLSGGGGGPPGGTCSSACGSTAGKACAKITEKTDCAPPQPTLPKINASDISLQFEFGLRKTKLLGMRSIEALYVGLCDANSNVSSSEINIQLPENSKCRWFKTQATDKASWINRDTQAGKAGVQSGIIKGLEDITQDSQGAPLKQGQEYLATCLYFTNINNQMDRWFRCHPQKFLMSDAVKLDFPNILSRSNVVKTPVALNFDEYIGGAFAYSHGGYTLGQPIGNYITIDYPVNFGSIFHDPFVLAGAKLFNFRPGVCPMGTAENEMDTKCTFFEPLKKCSFCDIASAPGSFFRNISVIKSADGKSLENLTKGEKYLFTCQFDTFSDAGIPVPIPSYIKDYRTWRCKPRVATFPADGSLPRVKLWGNILDNLNDSTIALRSSDFHSVIRMREENPGIRIVSLSQQGSTLCDVNGDKACDLKDFNICMSEYGPRKQSSTCDLTNDSHVSAEDISLLLFK